MGYEPSGATHWLQGQEAVLDGVKSVVNTSIESNLK
jgi:hypothetical protein